MSVHPWICSAGHFRSYSSYGEADIGIYKGYELANIKDSFNKRMMVRGSCIYTVESKKVITEI